MSVPNRGLLLWGLERPSCWLMAPRLRSHEQMRGCQGMSKTSPTHWPRGNQGAPSSASPTTVPKHVGNGRSMLRDLFPWSSQEFGLIAVLSTSSEASASQLVVKTGIQSQNDMVNLHQLTAFLIHIRRPSPGTGTPGGVDAQADLSIRLLGLDSSMTTSQYILKEMTRRIAGKVFITFLSLERRNSLKGTKLRLHKW